MCAFCLLHNPHTQKRQPHLHSKVDRGSRSIDTHTAQSSTTSKTLTTMCGAHHESARLRRCAFSVLNSIYSVDCTHCRHCRVACAFRVAFVGGYSRERPSKTRPKICYSCPSAPPAKQKSSCASVRATTIPAVPFEHIRLTLAVPTVRLLISCIYGERFSLEIEVTLGTHRPPEMHCGMFVAHAPVRPFLVQIRSIRASIEPLLLFIAIF